MKQYIYKPEEIGLRQWPSGELRLDGIEVTTDPAQADLFVCPGPLQLFQRPEMLDKFPYMASREKQHVFFDVSDYETIYHKACIFIRCNTRSWYYKADPNTISWAWPVENYAECVDVPVNGFYFDVSFQGWLSSLARRTAVESCQRSALRFDLAGYKDFCGYIYDTDEGRRRRAEFRRSMRESRVALCPESIPGVFPYRFFEAMSAGRVPLLVCTNHVLPFMDKIPYKDFCLFLESDNAKESAAVIDKFVHNTPDVEIAAMGRMAREYFLKYLNRDDWPRTMAAAVIEKVKLLGIVVDEQSKDCTVEVLGSGSSAKGGSFV